MVVVVNVEKFIESLFYKSQKIKINPEAIQKGYGYIDLK